jgi:hypothetical protein
VITSPPTTTPSSARAVNDGTGEAGRDRLAALVPAMIGTGDSGAPLLASSARLVLCCAGAPPGRRSWPWRSCAPRPPTKTTAG